MLRTNPKFDPIEIATSYKTGLAAALKLKPDVAILNENLGEDSKTGTDMVVELRALAPNTKTPILTAHTEVEVALHSMKQGAGGFRQKDCKRPVDPIWTSAAGDPGCAANPFAEAARWRGTALAGLGAG